MSKYNFYNKISCVKFFNCDNDVELQKAILNEFDRLSNMEERQEFTSAIRNAGINIHNLNSTRSYTKHVNEELSYQEADQKIREFANNFNQELDKEANMNAYQKSLYQNDPEAYEWSEFINEAMEENPEDNREFKSADYYKMQHAYAMKMQEFSDKRNQQLEENRARREAQQNDNRPTVKDILDNLD